MRKKQLLTGFLAALLLFSAAACAQKQEAAQQPSPPADAVGTEADTDVLSDEIIATLDGNSAKAELFNFWLDTICTNLENSYGIDVAESWDMETGDGQTLEDFVREDVLTAIKQQLVLENMAEQYGITLSEEDEAAIAKERESYLEEFGGEAGYRSELARLGISEEGFERLTRTDYLYRALYNSYCTPGSPLCPSDEVLLDYAVNSGYITADHILLMTVDSDSREPLDEETVAQQRQLAEDLLWPVALFDTLADEYGEDPGRALNPQGYTFTYGRMVEPFDTAARALGENEYSDIVVSDYGYHIILRRPLDTAAALSAVREEYFNVIFTEELEKAQLELTDSAEKLDVRTIYTLRRAAQALQGASG